MRELKPTTEESIRHFETQQKRYVREHNGKLCPHYANAIIALRRAQPENSRQHALQTGVCPMCEDCPDGCPILAPNDSRNIVTNADRIRGMSDEELARNNVRVTYMCEVDYDYEEESYERWIGVYETSDGRQFDFYESAIEHEIDWLQSPVETEGTE